MFLKIEDKIINLDNVTYASLVYKALDKQGRPATQPEPSLTINFIGGSSMSFNGDVATALWERLIRDAEGVQ